MSRTSNSVESSLAEWPPMKFVQSEQAWHITGKYMAPSKGWQFAFPLFMFMIFLPLFMLYSCVYTTHTFYGGELTDEGALYSTLGSAGLVVLMVMAGAVFGPRRNLNVKMSREAIQIGGRKYSRAEPHQFAREPHEKAHGELVAAERSGHKTRIYRDAMQVVMRYGERRVPIADFRRQDLHKAQALVMRLQSLDVTFDRIQAAEQGQAPGAPGERDDFGPAPPIR